MGNIVTFMTHAVRERARACPFELDGRAAAGKEPVVQ
jgi:hypothetical protein